MEIVNGDGGLMAQIKTGTTAWHMDIIKKIAFRGKIESREPLIVTIKVSSKKAKSVMEGVFKQHGIIGIIYKVKLLGWFECWFPRYQVEV